MRLASICACFVLVALPLALGPARPASACEPGTEHSVRITEDDSPDCVTVTNG